MTTTRRNFLRYFSVIGLSLAARQYYFGESRRYSSIPELSARSRHPDKLVADLVLKVDNSVSDLVGRHPADNTEVVGNSVADLQASDDHVVDNLGELSKTSELKPEELILQDHELVSLQAAVSRLQRLQNFVGYANFNVIGWDQSLKFARNYSDIGAFENSELEFIEQIFSTDAGNMGFYGDKVVTQISSSIRRNDIEKIPATGHYLFKGDSLRTYGKIRKDIGDDIILTSGIRGVVKQIYLFLKKTSDVGGNLSTASLSLAPPGHSFHAIGDFDVGKVNFGKRNFTEAFANTDEFRKLFDLGYINIRYSKNNPFGVRYEPWHIKVVS